MPYTVDYIQGEISDCKSIYMYPQELDALPKSKSKNFLDCIKITQSVK